MPDVIKLLETDHREVEDLFAKAESTDGAAKQQVVTKLASELTLHAEVEEQIVYPAMRAAGLTDIVQEAEEEHAKVKQLVAQLESMDAADVEHHVEEEESEGFPKFRDAVDQATLQELATQVQDAKQARS
jgi:iron-sulfur cluster repair protein YtfE (RIC family)